MRNAFPFFTPPPPLVKNGTLRENQAGKDASRDLNNANGIHLFTPSVGHPGP
jgi:hypothetical protein